MLICYWSHDSSTNEFLIRNPWGGKNSDSRDMEWWAPLSEITSASNPNSIFLTDPITIPKSYSYTITSDAASSGAAFLKVNLLLSQSRGIMWGTKPLFI